VPGPLRMSSMAAGPQHRWPRADLIAQQQVLAGSNRLACRASVCPRVSVACGPNQAFALCAAETIIMLAAACSRLIHRDPIVIHRDPRLGLARPGYPIMEMEIDNEIQQRVYPLQSPSAQYRDPGGL
jgi:hypothetical protein